MEPMWLDSGVEQNDITVENEVYTFFFEGHQAYGVLSNFRTTDVASHNTSKLTLSSNVRMIIMILRRKHIHKFGILSQSVI